MTDRVLPFIHKAAASGACCDACAAESVPVGSAAVAPEPERTATATARAQFVVVELDVRRLVSRTADRRITLAGFLVSAGFLAAAMLPESVRRGRVAAGPPAVSGG